MAVPNRLLCRMAATPYPAYDLARLMSLVGRISEAPSGKTNSRQKRGIKKPAVAGFLSTERLLQQRDIRNLQEEFTQFRQQRQAVDAHLFIVGVHHHVLKELIHRLAQLRQLD